MKVFFVNKRLAFGSSVHTNRHVERLREMGVTHVINLRRRQRAKVKQFVNLWLGFKDDRKPRPAWFHRRALKFYRKAVSTRHARIYVMCHYGLRRSPSMVYFLLRSFGVRPKEAETLVVTTRPQAKVVKPYREAAEEFLERFGNGRRM